MFIRCLDRYCDQMSDVLQGLLQKADSGLGFIAEILLYAAAEASRSGMRRGCLLMNTATEFAQKDPEIAARVTRGFERLRGVLTSAIQRGQQEGDITSDQDAGVLASYLISSLGGLKAVVKGGEDENRVNEIIGVTLRALV